MLWAVLLELCWRQLQFTLWWEGRFLFDMFNLFVHLSVPCRGNLALFMCYFRDKAIEWKLWSFYDIYLSALFIKPRSRRLGGFLLCLRFFLSFCQLLIPNLCGWCHYQPITGHFSGVFVISPLRRVWSS